MTQEQQQDFNQRLEKRKRIKRMKNLIISVIAIWMALSLTMIVILTIKVFSLQRQIKILSGEIKLENVVEVDQRASLDGDIATNVYNEDGVLIDNAASEGDILKVYLTFDDGPSDNTEEILDILDDYNVKATFFVTGKEDEEYQKLYKRIVDDGHTIAMHSYSHKYSEIYTSLDAFEKDYNKIQNLIYDITGVESMYYRFPGGSSNKVSNIPMSEFMNYLDSKNIKYFDWNVSSGDATSQAFTADELVGNVLNDVVKYKTSVVLLHDSSNKDTTVKALPTMIEALQAKGALILPIEENTTVIQHMNVTD